MWLGFSPFNYVQVGPTWQKKSIPLSNDDQTILLNPLKLKQALKISR